MIDDRVRHWELRWRYDESRSRISERATQRKRSKILGRYIRSTTGFLMPRVAYTSCEHRAIHGCSDFRFMPLCRTDTSTRNRDRISESDEQASSFFSLSRALPIAIRFLSKTFTLGLGRVFNAPSTRFYVRRLRAISILILLARLGKVSAGSLLHRISPTT